MLNSPTIQNALALVPYFGRPAPVVLSNGELAWATLTTLVISFAALWPVFKPRSRRILDTVLLAQRRVFIGVTSLAALGFFNYHYRLLESTLMLTTVILLVPLPVYMAAIRCRPPAPTRAVIVGDDPETITEICAATDLLIMRYLSMPTWYALSGELERGRSKSLMSGRCSHNSMSFPFSASSHG